MVGVRRRDRTCLGGGQLFIRKPEWPVGNLGLGMMPRPRGDAAGSQRYAK